MSKDVARARTRHDEHSSLTSLIQARPNEKWESNPEAHTEVQST